jgi:EAL domain-containing protein (putative c-di-GMP-specific phosphodiesterase class I)
MITSDGIAYLPTGGARRVRAEGGGGASPPGTAGRETRQLRLEIVSAIAAKDMALAYVPRFAIASPKVGAVEAVVRWQHRRRGAISEAALLGLAEKSGATAELQRWAFATGCEVLAGLPAGMRMAFTLTPWQVRHPGLFGAIDAALDRNGLRPDQIELSLSETALETLDSEAQMVLAGLFDDGFSLAVGQFGAVMGSLTLLSRFPLDRVKLDAGVVRRTPADPDATAMVAAVVSVAHAMGARVVATGLENEAQRQCLADLGCDEAHGPFYGRPVGEANLLNIVV